MRSTPPISAVPSGPPTGCFVHYFRGIAKGRVHIVEDGAHDLNVIGTGQAKRGIFGLEFTESGKPFGAIRVGWIPSSQLFKIESVVDRGCSPTTTFSNETEPALDPRVLVNYDTVRLHLGAGYYDLRLGADGTIQITFGQVTP